MNFLSCFFCGEGDKNAAVLIIVLCMHTRPKVQEKLKNLPWNSPKCWKHFGNFNQSWFSKCSEFSIHFFERFRPDVGLTVLQIIKTLMIRLQSFPGSIFLRVFCCFASWGIIWKWIRNRAGIVLHKNLNRNFWKIISVFYSNICTVFELSAKVFNLVPATFLKYFFLVF